MFVQFELHVVFYTQPNSIPFNRISSRHQHTNSVPEQRYAVENVPNFSIKTE
jgi:hypothetical protein